MTSSIHLTTLTARLRRLFLLLMCILSVLVPGGCAAQNARPAAAEAGQVMVTFKVEIPANSPGGEVVSLLILDEVTGLGLKPERHDMRMLNLTHYMVTLPLTPGTTLKYRYARQGAAQADERFSNASPVRYRMYKVSAPAAVQDYVSLWSDTAYNIQVGDLEGTVRDGLTGEGVSGLLVLCGGAQVKTGWNGRFSIAGLPAGVNNLVVYAPDGSYATFQQGAQIRPGTTTRAFFDVQRAGRVSVVIRVTVPEETPQRAVVRIAGNLSQLGNTFDDLPGGASVQASRAPAMLRVDDRHYALALDLPAGADVLYKYTLGDGFWNAERNPDGGFVLRRLVVPGQSTMVTDEVYTWRDGGLPPRVFQHTAHEGGATSVQFFLHSWTQEIPAWQLEDDRHWTYTLYSPLDLLDTEFKARFCSQGRCTY